MKKHLFVIISIIGLLLISILSFTIPNNPNEIIPAISIMGFDKPLWLCYIVGFGFVYLLIIWSIYDLITKKYNQ